MRIPPLAIFGLAACTAPVSPPAQPPGDPTPSLEQGIDWGDVDLGRVDGEPVLQGSNLSLTELTVRCAPGPDPRLDNEDPGAEAEHRWLIELKTRGWASVTAGVRVFVWDGDTDASGRHQLAYRAGVSMSQVPSGQSSAPYGTDQYALTIPVLPDLGDAEAIAGTVLQCLDPVGMPTVQAHDLMVCALDARDLETTACWFCGEHLGAPSTPTPDTVGRISYAPGPLASAFSVTETVQCTYGDAQGATTSR